MSNTVEDLFILLRISSDIILVILGLIFIKRVSKQTDLAVILASCLFDSIYILIGEFVDLTKSSSSELYFGSFTVVEFLFFAYFIAANILNKRFKWFLVITAIAFVIFNLAYSYITNFRIVDSVPIGIETIFIFLYAFCYLFEQTSVELETFIYQRFQFWIIIGILLYLAGSFFIYVLANQVDRETLDDYWFLTNGLFVLKNILFAVGIFVYLKQFKKSNSSQSIRPYLN